MKNIKNKNVFNIGGGVQIIRGGRPRLIFVGILFMAIAAIFISILLPRSDAVRAEDSYLTVSPGSININCVAMSCDSGAINIQSNGNWTVSSDALWVTLDKNSGSGNDSVMVGSSACVNGSATILIMGGGITQTVSVSSYCDENGGAGGDGFDITISPTWIESGCSGVFNYRIEVSDSSNYWSASSDQSWVSVSPTGDLNHPSWINAALIIIDSRQDYGNSVRMATIEFSNEYGRTAQVTVYQSGGCAEEPSCDPLDPSSECYEPPCDPTDPTGDCYEEIPCDPTNINGECYESPIDQCDTADPNSECYKPVNTDTLLPPDTGNIALSVKVVGMLTLAGAGVWLILRKP